MKIKNKYKHVSFERTFLIMKNRKKQTNIRIIAIILAVLITLSIVIPIFYKSVAAVSDSNTTNSVVSSSKIIVNYYKITDSKTSKDITELTKDSDAFDLTIGLLDPNASAIEGFESETGYAVLESTSFYGETTNTGSLKQTGNTNSDGPMKLIASFKNIKFNGQSNTLTARIGYTIDGVSKSELISFLISQIPIDEEKETKKDPAPPPSPRIVIDECTFGDKTINTEESFSLNINYFNSSNAVKMENLKIELSGGENFVIKSNSNTFYVEELGPKGIKNLSTDFTALKSIKESSSYPISLKFSYEYVINDERKNGEDATQIFIPVHKVVPSPRLTISDISCSPTEIEEEEESTVTIQLANKGESDVKNVSIAISGNFKSDSYVKEIGTISSGKVTFPTFAITTLPTTTTSTTSSASSKSETKTAQKTSAQTTPTRDSKITGTAVITFEDEDGNQHTIDRSFGLNVNLEEDNDLEMIGDGRMPSDQMGSEMGDIQEDDKQTPQKLSTPLLIGLIAGGVIIIGGASYFIVKKIKAKRSELLDEDI